MSRATLKEWEVSKITHLPLDTIKDHVARLATPATPT